ncbi:hypothetical protein K440DRAFT_619852 [Wilcoxina mikolae CBS 423.85]|nr:hypothetical protein K440DRAFT_619852 [Wilcoxina mikolae CBS 423.85]
MALKSATLQPQLQSRDIHPPPTQSRWQQRRARNTKAKVASIVCVLSASPLTGMHIFYSAPLLPCKRAISYLSILQPEHAISIPSPSLPARSGVPWPVQFPHCTRCGKIATSHLDRVWAYQRVVVSNFQH